MKLSIHLIALATLLVYCARAQVINLTSRNFDHDTQIGSHMTTGSWFIKFYAPWCGHCQRLNPIWEEVASEISNQVNVAQVDCDSEKELADRFDIKAYPTLLFFKDDLMHIYEGPRNAEDLIKFAQESFKRADAKPVPSRQGLMGKVRRALLKTATDLDHIWAERAVTGGFLLFVGTTFGLSVGITLGGLMTASQRAKKATATTSQKRQKTA